MRTNGTQFPAGIAAPAATLIAVGAVEFGLEDGVEEFLSKLAGSLFFR